MTSSVNISFFRSCLLLMVILIGNCHSGKAQVEVSHSGDWFYIEPGTDVHIIGSLISTTGNTQPLANLGDMYISDSVSCYGDNRIFGPTPDTITANIFLNGQEIQTFTGDKNMRFGNLYVRNTYDSLSMSNNVEVYNFLQLDSGNINTTSHTLDLLTTGRIIGENNDRRIYTEPYGQIHLNRPLLIGTTYTDLAGTGFGLTIDGNLGTNVDVYRANHQQPTASNGSIDRFYSFNPQFNAMVSHPVTDYFTNELHGNDESELAFYRSPTSGVTWLAEAGTIDTVADLAQDPALSFVLTTTTMLTLAEKDCDSLPYIEFPRDTVAICGSGNAWLTPNGITGLSSVWSNGELNKDSIQVTAPGNYEVIVTDLQGCPNSDSVTVVIAPVPVANFSNTPVCIGDTSFFTNQSTISTGTLTHFWDLNDVYTSAADTTSSQDPSIVYTNPGAYTVTLITTSNLECTDTLTTTSVVLDYPVADFVVADLCEDSTLAIANLTTITPAAGLTYVWDFGNGDTDTQAQPSYAYTSNGPQTITLTATSNGCTSTTTRPVNVFPNPVAAFNHTTACLGDSTTFTNTSTLSSGTQSFLWTFSQGNQSTLTDPTFAFPTSGIHPVTLEATSNQGCIHDTTITVTVNALPQPTFTAVPTCQGDPAQFTNTSPAASTYLWDFNGEGNSTTYNGQFVFTTDGTKAITLTETDANGCTNSTVQPFTSKPSPTAAFTTTGGCEGDPVAFLNTSSTPNGTLTYQWDLGDGTTSNLTTPSHTYGSSNTFNVQLIAENNGCFDTLIQPVTIDPLPIVNLGGNITTCDSQYIFDAQNPGSIYLWSDATTAQTLTATYNGSYWVQVTNTFGCVTNDTVQLTLNSIVQPQLGSDSTFCNAATLDAGYPGGTYIWSTGATTQTITTPTTGPYWVEVTDQNNCVGSDTINITVVPAVQPDLGPDLDLCDGTQQTLDPTNTGVTYLWNTGATTQTITVSQSGTYWIDLTDANGCIERDSIILIYNPNPIVDLGPDGLYCDSIAYDLTQSNTSYDWNTGGTTPILTLNTTGIYSVELTNTTTGCQSQDTIDLTISISPTVDLGTDTILCSGANLLLDAANPGFTYLWNIGDTTQTVIAASSGIYAVDVTTPDGCTTTDSIDVQVSAPMDTDLGADFTLCGGQTVSVTSPINGATYQWTHNGTVLSETQQTLDITAFGTYVLLVTDSIGCTATDTVIALETGSSINAEFLVQTSELFAGDTLQFVNLSYPEPFTSYWSFGDGAFSIDEDPVHTYFAAGTYTATLEVSNGICTDTLSKLLNVLPRVVILPPEPDSVVINDITHFILYPNPNTGSFTVEVELLKEADLRIACVDMMGRVLFSENRTGKEFQLHYESLDISAGVYFFNLQVNERSRTFKFIKL